MIGRRRALRRGFSLIELAIVVGGVSIVIGLCGSLLHALLKLDRAGRESLNDAATLDRLARQFRQDVRASESSTAKPGAGLELKGVERPTITYRVEGGRLLREERVGETVRRRESYDVGRLGPVTFDDGDEDGLVRLILSRRPSNAPALARPAIEVVATLGKDRAAAEASGDW